jgi:hypothetical protein
MASDQERIIELEKKVSELETTNRLLKKDAYINNICGVFKAFIKFAGFVWIACFSYLSIEAIAGKNTQADVKAGLDVAINTGPSIDCLLPNIISLVIAVAAIGYGIWQRKLLGRTLEQIQPHKEELERRWDKKRSSSSLKSKGETNRGDRID